jgi:hypothetical protein
VVLLLAHVGHWALWLLYAVPVLIVLGSIGLQIASNRADSVPGDAADREDERETGDRQPDARPGSMF